MGSFYSTPEEQPKKETAPAAYVSEKVTKSTALPEGVSRTKEMDIISWDDDPSTDRFKMPCGHAIGADILKGYLDSEIAEGNVQIRCPKCEHIWKLSTIRDILKASSLEYEYIETIITEHFLYMGYSLQSCPACYTVCERESRLYSRVICLVCRQDGNLYEFCWHCLKQWKSKGIQRCGNQDCPGEDPALKTLRECNNVVMDFSKVSCPSIRACPSCYMLIEHNGGCKTMTCNGCRQTFCFVCLEKANSQGNLPCGDFSTPCKVAPIQEHLFKPTE